MGFTRCIDIDFPYDQAVTATKAAPQEQGFGTLTEIDLRHTLKDKLDVDTDPQVIIGACSPQLAQQAQRRPARCTLLPCNVVVRTEHGHTVVDAARPAMMAAVFGAARARRCGR